VDNIESEVDKLTSNSASVISAITEVGEGIKVAVLKDPFGNAVGLIEEAGK
jgi:predicted enzyme related to lactoylglutathione lyase